MAIRHLDEHWNGKGHPTGLKGEQISMLGRILGISQTVEVFFAKAGFAATREMLAVRKGEWFDPQLADVLLNTGADHALWQDLQDPNPDQMVAAWEPQENPRWADEETLDRVAEAFAQVVDAKSPWTFRHSQGVADISIGMATHLGLDAERLRWLRRTALLHDIGKLGVSNMILDKPGKLTDEEFAAIKRHPQHSEQILTRVALFADQALIAGSHHERLDGRGYHRGIPSGGLPLEARILMVADIFEALTAAHPYREGMPVEKVMGILEKDAGIAVCPDAFQALKVGWRRGTSQLESKHSWSNWIFWRVSWGPAIARPASRLKWGSVTLASFVR